ncbi:DUF7692 domain-containing protein [Natronomonas salsuginis]|uniref:DUF7692 domain-containing protein n=1 Tax=Natronomonas salsuginis TaxID=2217661 RepID=A0A4U5JCU1_9EURY|nr:hypothetical protein [Natronomonas salsuginis]TKR25698.1 hypothetical protein DM868_09830 [Natronomonas salsuginis]
MRIRTDGKHSHRDGTIDRAADFWSCNKTTALMKSAEFTYRMDQNIRELFERDDLTIRQKREIADTLTVPATYEIEIAEEVQLHTE